MSRNVKTRESNRSGQYQSVQITVNPKSRNLDKTIHDILKISELVVEQFPSVKIKSIAVNDYFAVVKADIPKQISTKETTLRLYEIKGKWKIRGCAFSEKEPQTAV